MSSSPTDPVGSGTTRAHRVVGSSLGPEVALVESCDFVAVSTAPGPIGSADGRGDRVSDADRVRLQEAQLGSDDGSTGALDGEYADGADHEGGAARLTPISRPAAAAGSHRGCRRARTARSTKRRRPSPGSNGASVACMGAASARWMPARGPARHRGASRWSRQAWAASGATALA